MRITIHGVVNDERLIAFGERRGEARPPRHSPLRRGGMQKAAHGDLILSIVIIIVFVIYVIAIEILNIICAIKCF